MKRWKWKDSKCYNSKKQTDPGLHSPLNILMLYLTADEAHSCHLSI